MIQFLYMRLSEEQILDFKKILEKEKGKEVSMAEATDGAHRLAGLAEIIYKGAQEDIKRKQKLKDNPKGYTIEGSYTCRVCKDILPEHIGWYDKWGIKCMTCQNAINKKIIPGSQITDDDKWYSKWDLESRFGLNRHGVKKFKKEGILISREILNDNGSKHCEIFLIKDNKDFLPPKKLVESHLVPEKRDGKIWHHSEPWYRFVDPYEHLKDYKIMNYIEFVPSKDKKK